MKTVHNLLDEIYFYHQSVIDELFTDKSAVSVIIDNSFASLKEYLSAGKNREL